MNQEELFEAMKVASAKAELHRDEAKREMVQAAELGGAVTATEHLLAAIEARLEAVTYLLRILRVK